MKRTGSLYQCLTCGHHFAGPHSFARHRADLQCLSPDEMQSAGMALNAAGFWTIERTARAAESISLTAEPAT